MTAMETAKAVLAMASFYDQTFARPDVNIARAWAKVLGDVNTDDAVQAVVDHYSKPGAARVMVGDVRAAVGKMRAERIKANFTEPEYDGDDVLGGLAAIRAHRKAIADGEVVEINRPALAKRDMREVFGKDMWQLPPGRDGEETA